jgi:TPP-dependent pyruvate/acetoin dehydrogenase alpha subunit
MENWTVELLKEFEEDIANSFNMGEIRSPVHLSDGNEAALIQIFKDVKKSDWVFCSWRSHYQCLLKGVNPADLKTAIYAGRSIALAFPDFRIFSSAIVGGQLPIALGAALAIKKNKGTEKVWCFLGDMTSETGMAQSTIRYAHNHELPITFIVENNGLSVLTDTRKVWNSTTLRYEELNSPLVISFDYKSKYPHAGAGVRVQF